MKPLRLLVAFLVLGCIGARAQEARKPEKVDCLCGHLQQEKKTGKQHTGASVFENVPVAKALVYLYPSDSSGNCCLNLIPLEQTTTGKNGFFDFREYSAGNYWLYVLIGKQEYKMGIQHKPAKNNAIDCNKFLYTVDKDGKFLMQTVVAAS